MTLKTLDNILYHQLAPWLPANKVMDKFKVLLKDLNQKSFDTFYDLEYHPQLNEKYKYYYLTVHNTVYTYLEEFKDSYNNATNPDHQSFLISKFNNNISQYFSNTQEVIQQRGYNFNEINLPINNSIRDEIYIIHLVKEYLIWLYLEVKETVQEHQDFEFLDESMIRGNFFNEFNFTSRIKEVPEPLKQELQVEQFHKSTKFKFEVKPYDFREPKNGVLSLEVIVLNSSGFELFENHLFENKFINENYNFIKNKKTHNSENFALALLALISKGYLRKKNLGKDIKSVDYRNFFEHRYRGNVDKQIRNFEKQPEKVQQFIEDNFWLSNMPRH
jgi:hypothetical protein